MFAKYGSLDEARMVFDELPELDRSHRGLTEPGSLFKNLIAILRDVVICHDNTVRNMCSNSIIQFEYGFGGAQSEFCAGDPIGVLAATAMSNPAYKAVLDSSPSSNSSWKTTLQNECFFGMYFPFKNWVFKPTLAYDFYQITLLDLKLLEFGDALFKEFQYHGEFMASEGIITLRDIEDAKNNKDSGRVTPDEEFEEYLRHLIGEKCTRDRNEMAQLPEGITELVHYEKLCVPLLSYIFNPDKCTKLLVSRGAYAFLMYFVDQVP